MSAVIAHHHQLFTKHIYNHDIMNCTAEGVVGNHLYSGRALGITSPTDKIQMHHDLKPLWKYIAAHYDRIGLPHTKDVLWHIDLQQIGCEIGFHPSVFYFGENEFQNWGDHLWYETVDFINSKNNFMAVAEQLGVDVPKTRCFDSATDITDEAIQTMNYPCYLKAAISVSGVGIYRCENQHELIANIKLFDAAVPVQLQEEIKTDIFLNMQYICEGDEVRRLAASEQILDGFTHQGNRVPACYEPWQSVDDMALWLKDRGMKGIFAFDVAVVQTDSGLRFPAIECNPRFNGASYPTLIAQKLGISEWRAITVSTEHRDLRYVDLSGIEFDKETQEGVILVNWGTVLAGKLMVLLAGTASRQEELRIELASRL